jgi:hypothetical protein
VAASAVVLKQQGPIGSRLGWQGPPRQQHDQQQRQGLQDPALQPTLEQ